MVDIIRLNDDPHAQTQQLLPWYVTKTLKPDEQARVAAHLAECAECREDLKLEQALARQMKTVGAEAEADDGWATLKARAEGRRTPSGRIALLSRRISVGWAFAQAAGLAAVVSLGTFVATRPAPVYRTLSAPPAPATGNLIVVFRPDASVDALRTTLTQNHARIVDGPTAGGAYVLHVAAEHRDAALTRLKDDTHIALAEPIDGDDH